MDLVTGFMPTYLQTLNLGQGPRPYPLTALIVKSSYRNATQFHVYQNAVAVNDLKIDFLLNQTFASIHQATTSVKQSISIYNNERHLSLGYQTPQVYQPVTCTHTRRPGILLDTIRRERRSAFRFFLRIIYYALCFIRRLG